MDKKKIIFIIIAFIGVIMLFRFSGVLKMYKIPSSSSEPNLNVGSRIIGSSLKKPKRLDFAYFKFSDSLDGWTIVKRLIAVPGDVLEFKKGNYFVNGDSIDNSINLRFAYKISSIVFETHIRGDISDIETYRLYNNDSVIAFLDNSFVEKLPVKLDKIDSDANSKLAKEISKENPDWTLSNFGPIVLPEKKYFFSGDNRDNSIDSRHRGFVEEENILGTVLINF